MEVGWIPGKNNFRADALSRLIEERIYSECFPTLPLEEFIVEGIVLRSNKDLQEKNMSKLKKANKNRFKEKKKSLEVKRKKLIVENDENPDNSENTVEKETVFSQERKKLLLRTAHQGHTGVPAMHLSLKNYVWDTKKEDILKHVQVCQVCPRKRKPIKSKLKGLRPQRLGEIFAVDLATSVGSTINAENANIFICTELLSGFTYIEVITDKKAETVALCMEKAIGLMGKPAKLLTDNGKEFSGRFEELLKEQFIRQW